MSVPRGTARALCMSSDKKRPSAAQAAHSFGATVGGLNGHASRAAVAWHPILETEQRLGGPVSATSGGSARFVRVVGIFRSIRANALLNRREKPRTVRDMAARFIRNKPTAARNRRDHRVNSNPRTRSGRERRMTDPCAVALTTRTETPPIAYGHSHPYFSNHRQMNEGAGCLRERNWDRRHPPRWNIQNSDFSPADRTAAESRRVPLYLLTPKRLHVKVYRQTSGRWH